MKLTSAHMGLIRRIGIFLLVIFGGYAFGQPVADFTATPVSGCAPLQVQLLDLSQGGATGWNWNLGNGQTSTQKNPSVTYLTPGVYTVQLIASNADGSNTAIKTSYITVYSKPTVNFTVGDSNRCVPFATVFRDVSTTSTGTISSWDWDFDDGSVSNSQHPLHQYNNQGNYNITLRVTNSGGCSNSLTKLAYIKASDSIRTNFTFTRPTQCRPPETIRFINNTTGPGNLSFSWNFGDGNFSTNRAPSHTYLAGGLYSITLIVRNDLGCVDTVLLKDTIGIKSINSVINGPDSLCRSVIGRFVNATQPTPLSTAWRFDDGTNTFGLSTARQWDVPGNYTIRMVSRYSNCQDSVSKNITILTPPTINIVADDSASCSAPLNVNFSAVSRDAVRWLWRFGDGDTSTQQNPVHTFLSNGDYNVKLTVIDNAGCESVVRRNPFIKIGPPVVLFLDSSLLGGCVPYLYSPQPTIASPEPIVSYYWNFGNGTTSTLSNPSVNYTATGNYPVSLTTTTLDGCTVTTNTSVSTGTPSFVNFGVADTSQCPGIDLQFSDSSVNVNQWKWLFGDGQQSNLQNPVHQYDDTGYYTVKLVAWSNGCADSITKNRLIRVLPGLARFNITYDCADHLTVAFKDSSIAPQTLLWDFGDGTTSNLPNPTHSFSNYQTYLVGLTATNGGCTNTTLQNVTTIREIPDFSVSSNKTCKQSGVTFYLQNANKANLLTYTWNFGDGQIDSSGTDSIFHVYALPGSYTVTLTYTDIHGCITTTNRPNVIQVYSPIANFSINGAGGCSDKPLGFTDLSTTAYGTNNIAHWVWDYGDGTVQTFNAPRPANIQHHYPNAGSYYPSITITDSVGCSDSISYAVPVNIYKPVADFFSPNYNTCMRDTVLFRNPSTGTRLSYRWDFGDGTSSTAAIPFKQYTADGIYTVKLLVTDAFGCTDSIRKSNYVNVKEVSASFNMSDSVSTCVPFQVRFTNTTQNGLANRWNFGDGGLSSTRNPVYTFNTPGTYLVRLTSSRSTNCVSTYTSPVKINAPTGVLNYSPIAGCAPLQVAFQLSTPDKVSFIWDFGDGTSFSSTDSSVVHDYLLPGQFVPKAILKDSSGCIVSITNSDTIRLYSSKVNFSASDTLLCGSGFISFFDSTTAGSPVTGYRWDFGDGNTSTQQNPTHTYTNEGLYTVRFSMQTSFGCADSITKTNFIQIAPKPAVSILGDTSFCGQTMVTLQGSLAGTGTATHTWNWNFGNGNTSSLQNPPGQLYQDTGRYAVQLAVLSSDGCTDTSGRTVVIHPLPSISVSNDTSICEGSTASLYVNGNQTNYSWQPATGLSCVNCTNPVSSVLTDQAYVVSAVSAAGCAASDTVLVRVKHPFRITGLPSADSICAGESIALAVAGAENYVWTPATGLNNASTGNVLAAPGISTFYKVVGFDSANCFRDSASIQITVTPVPTVNAGPDITLASGRSVQLNPITSADVLIWQWTPAATLSCSNCVAPVATPPSDVTYTIQVSNAGGCTATDDVVIKISCDQSNLFIPTAFTPNGDTKNNIFVPFGVGIYKITSFKIFNREGTLVFLSGNFNAGEKRMGWNGTYKGLPAPVGNYIYTIEYICDNKKVVNRQGNILLLR